MTSARTRWLGVLGWPVAHSRSPAIHSAAFDAAGIDAVYLAFAVPPEELPGALAGLRALGALGANVTLPHKERVMALLDEVEPDARAIGAVNTVVREGGRLVGANTDAPGLVRALEERGVSPRGREVLVIGAGGAARASVVGLARAGAVRVTVAARRVEQAQRLVEELAEQVPAPLAAIDLADRLRLGREGERAELLVQASSATMEGSPVSEPFAAHLPIERLPASAAVADLVYAPRETAVLRAARERGLGAIDGLGMLVWQAALAFERWTGVAAPIDAMRSAAEAGAAVGSSR